jgi:hypothetical protein
MGLFSFGGSKSDSESNSSSSTFVDPNQSPYLQDIYGQAQQLNAQGMPVEGVAGINGMLGGALGTAYGAGGMQAGVGANMMASGANATQGTGMALNYAGGAMGGNAQGGINTAMGAGQGMANMAGMMGAANNQGFNAANAGQYMNNSVLNGQIDAASRDVVRNLQENQLTGIASNAAGTGNSGSSRAGVMAGIAARGAGDRIGDISASMRGQAYNTGLGIEANRASQNAGFQQQANQANQGAYNNMLQFGAGMGQNAYNTNQQNQQFGAGMAAQLGQQGYGNMLSGANMMNQGIGMQQGAGQYIRDYDQQLLNNQYQQAMSPFNSLNFYSNLVGAPNNLSEAESSSNSSSMSVSGGFG